MKTRFFFLFFIVLNTAVSQENLIQNGSFEEISQCYGDPAPLGFDVFDYSNCIGWSNPAYSSSDLWCSMSQTGFNEPPNITSLGFQYPKTGENFAGILILDVIDWNYREYIQNELAEKLKKNHVYNFQFFFNTTPSLNKTSCLDAYFSGEKMFSTQMILDETPQVLHDRSQFLFDTLNWIKYESYYKAEGDEKFVNIGCFDDSLNLKVTDNDWLNAQGIYMFIDDVSLVETPYYYSIPNVFTINNDLINDFFTPIVFNLNWNCKIFNRWGNEVVILNNDNSMWLGDNCEEGTYFYVFEGQDKHEIFTESGFIQLLRE